MLKALPLIAKLYSYKTVPSPERKPKKNPTTPLPKNQQTNKKTQPGGGGDVASISIYTVICFELLEKTLTCPETLIINIWIRI